MITDCAATSENPIFVIIVVVTINAFNRRELPAAKNPSTMKKKVETAKGEGKNEAPAFFVASFFVVFFSVSERERQRQLRRH